MTSQRAPQMLLMMGVLLASGKVIAASGSFSTLTYNVAGLPQGVSSAPSERQSATQLISCYVKAFDLVGVQEDFNYHAALYDSCDDHAYRSATSGGAGIGSGPNFLSRFTYSDWERVKWNSCNGVDCLTPKGFTLACGALRKVSSSTFTSCTRRPTPAAQTWPRGATTSCS